MGIKEDKIEREEMIKTISDACKEVGKLRTGDITSNRLKKYFINGGEITEEIKAILEGKKKIKKKIKKNK